MWSFVNFDFDSIQHEMKSTISGPGQDHAKVGWSCERGLLRYGTHRQDWIVSGSSGHHDGRTQARLRPYNKFWQVWQLFRTLFLKTFLLRVYLLNQWLSTIDTWQPTKYNKTHISDPYSIKIPDNRVWMTQPKMDWNPPFEKLCFK